MSNEEKKAIEYWKNHMEILHWNTQLASEHYIKVLLDLVEKQQKAIEDLENGDLTTVYISGVYDGEKKVEDKIKAKIEEFKQVRDTILENEKECKRPMMAYDLKRNDYCEKMLQSLLKEE